MCWTCSNAQSNTECQTNGKLKYCLRNEVRRIQFFSNRVNVLFAVIALSIKSNTNKTFFAQYLKSII